MDIKVLDAIGEWSEIKLEIIKEYSKAYTSILKSYPNLDFWYIDAFAGAGQHVKKTTAEEVTGSPINALRLEHSFHKYFFIDIKRKKVKILEELISKELKTFKEDKPSLEIIEGDCNEILTQRIFPQITYERYRRALCILDPYGLHLDWEVIKMAGKLRTVDIFLNFPIMDMNMNVLHRNKDSVELLQKDRMNRFWGDNSWEEIAYSSGEEDFFGYREKQTNDKIVNAFRKRPQTVGGFKNVAKPIAMKNSTDSTVYYLLFASQKDVASNIVTYIFNKYKNK